DWGVVNSKDGALIKLNVSGSYIGLIARSKFIPKMTDKIDNLIGLNEGNIYRPGSYGEMDSFSSESNSFDEVSLFAKVGYDYDLRMMRMDNRFYSPKLNQFITPDFFFV